MLAPLPTVTPHPASLLRLLERNARLHPHRLAVASPVATRTWLELLCDVVVLRRRLDAMGQPVGTRAAIRLPSSPEWVTAFLASRAAGLVVVSENPESTGAELRSSLEAWQVGTLITAPEDGDARRIATDAGIAVVEMQMPSIAHTDEVPSIQGSDVCDLLATAVLHFTSGSSGHPRAVQRSEANLIHEGHAVADALGERMDNGILCTTPVYHSFASGLWVAALARGVPLLLINQFSPQDILSLIDRHRPSVMAGVPYAFEVLSMLQQSRRYTTTSLRFAMSGGARLGLQCKQRFEKRFQVPLAQEYGLSEGGIVSINQDRPDRYPDSVGLPIAGVRVSAVDPRDPAMVVAPGRAGELVVQRPFCPTRYFSAPDESATRFLPALDAVRTGDLGIVHDDGRIELVGRIKQMIKIGGTSIAPKELEVVLESHPEISEAHVFAAPHALLNEVPMAVVVPRNGSRITVDQLVSYCRSRLSSFKVPRRLEILSSLPRTPSGKFDLEALKAELAMAQIGDVR